MSKSPPRDLLIAIARHESIPVRANLSSDFDVNAFGEDSERTLLLAAAYGGRSDSNT